MCFGFLPYGGSEVQDEVDWLKNVFTKGSLGPKLPCKVLEPYCYIVDTKTSTLGNDLNNMGPNQRGLFCSYLTPV